MSTVKILIVENELFIAEDLAQKLTDAGYEILGPVATGEKAIALTQQNKPDVIIMDIKLDGRMDGIECTLQIRKHHHIPTIYLTDLDDPKTIARATESKPAAFLTKPFAERQLIASIHQAFYRFSENIVALAPDAQLPESNTYVVEGALFIKTDNRHFRKFAIPDVLYIKSDGAYSSIHTADGTAHVYTINMKSVHSQISDPSFVRVSRSYVVNLNKVTEIKGNLLLVGSTEIQIGESYKETVMNSFPIIHNKG